MALESEADEVYYGGGAGGGKALSLDTLIPTVDGWTTMGEIEVGDVVFDEHGLPTKVVAVSSVMHDHVVYEVQFDDGTTITADAGHRWLTFTYADRKALPRRTDEARVARREARASRGTGKRPDLAERNSQMRPATMDAPEGGIRTTEEIAATLTARQGAHVNHAVPMAMPLDLPSVALPIAPYTLGAWLGDGTSAGGGFTCADVEILDSIRADGYEVTERSGPYAYGILGLQSLLRRAGLIGDKHIPVAYQRASYEQRLALLQGIVDTDGHVTTRGAVEIQIVSERLLRDVWRLLMTLGIRATVTEGRATLNGRDCGPKYRVKFTTTQPVARLPRKAERLPSAVRSTGRWRYIIGVRRVESVPVRCIAVDAPSHLYLASEALVPTHNTDLLLGYGLTRAHFGIVFRRQFTQLHGPEGVIERSKGIVGHPELFNNTRLIWRLGDRRLEFGGVDHEDDKFSYQGRAHDFKGFDEIAQFSESQYLYLIGWARTVIPGQRVRVIACGNPPQNAEGEWIIQRFAPWLDESYATPAKPGEVRWFVRTRADKEVEVAGAAPIEIDGETLTPKSRTFIPARVQDNPYLMATDYLANLQRMPEPLRSQLIYGDHSIGLQDDAWQVLPSAWVRAAQARWTPERPVIKTDDGATIAAPLAQIGADVAQGGADNTVLARRYGTWFAELEIHPGPSVPDAQHNADHIERALLEGGYAQIDSDGIGASTYHLLVPKVGHAKVRAYRGSAPTTVRDTSSVLTFANQRAAAWWALRDALDPSQKSEIALPPSRELRAELCAPRYEKQVRGLKIEDKDDTKKRLGRSPDLGDAVVMANWQGNTLALDAIKESLPLAFKPGTENKQDELRKRLEQLVGAPIQGRVVSR